MTGSGFRIGPPHDPDRYEVVRAVAAGAEGVLYLAMLPAAGATVPVAVKMLHPSHAGQIDRWKQRWLQQVELLRSIQSPGLVVVRDGFCGPMPHTPGRAQGEDTLYLVMNWVEGDPLDEWLEERPLLTVAERLALLLPVAAALDLMHSGRATGATPVIHGDLKPSNILVTPDGQSVLVDVGLASAIPDGAELTGVRGTPGFQAPELRANGLATPATDRYALGGVAFQLVTGRAPAATFEDNRVALAGVDAEVARHLLAMIDDDPDVRPKILANWCGQLRGSSLADDDPLLQPIAPSVRRSRPTRRVALAASIVVVVAAIGAAVALRGGDAPNGPAVVATSAAPQDAPSEAERAPSVPGSTPATSATTTPDSAPTTEPAREPRRDTKVLGAYACKNESLGYTMSAPSTLSEGDETEWHSKCEVFDWAPPPPIAEVGGVAILGNDIVFNRISDLEVEALLASDAIRFTTRVVDGREARVVEHRVPTRSGAAMVDVTTYLIPDGATTLVAQLFTPANLSAQHPQRRSIIEGMLDTLHLVPTVCRNSQRPLCGPFYYDGEVPQNAPLVAVVTQRSDVVHAGETFAITVEVTDPDADVITQEGDLACLPRLTEVLGEQIQRTSLVLEVVRGRSNLAVPSGPWDPPTPAAGAATIDAECVTGEPGSYSFRSTYRSARSTAPPFHDPFASATTIGGTFEVLPSL